MNESPFVKWSDEPAFIEGTVIGTWSGEYGLNVKFNLSQSSPSLGLDDRATLCLSHVSLRDTITPEDVGKEFHVAFEGWIQGKKNRFRDFVVLAAPEQEQEKGPQPEPEPEKAPATSTEPPFHLPDDLPF